MIFLLLGFEWKCFTIVWHYNSWQYWIYFRVRKNAFIFFKKKKNIKPQKYLVFDCQKQVMLWKMLNWIQIHQIDPLVLVIQYNLFFSLLNQYCFLFLFSCLVNWKITCSKSWSFTWSSSTQSCRSSFGLFHYFKRLNRI